MEEKEILKKLLELNKGSKSELANKMGLPRQSITNMTNPKKTPKLSTLNKMADALGYIIKFKIIKK